MGKHHARYWWWLGFFFVVLCDILSVNPDVRCHKYLWGYFPSYFALFFRSALFVKSRRVMVNSLANESRESEKANQIDVLIDTHTHTHVDCVQACVRTHAPACVRPCVSVFGRAGEIYGGDHSYVCARRTSGPRPQGPSLLCYIRHHSAHYLKSHYGLGSYYTPPSIQHRLTCFSCIYEVCRYKSPHSETLLAAWCKVAVVPGVG